MLMKLLKIYRPIEIHEQIRNDNPGPGIVVFERNSTIRCNNCKWNEYELLCYRYKLIFRDGKIVILTSLCMKMDGNNSRKQKYTLKSIKR